MRRDADARSKGGLVKTDIRGFHIHAFVFSGSFPLFKLLVTLKLASLLIKPSLVKAWKGYHVKGSRIPKPKK